MLKFRKDGARSATTEAVPVASKTPGSLSHEQLGALYYRRGEKERALEHYREAARQYPADPDVQKALADFCYVGLGRPEESLAAYRRVLELRPDDPEVLQIAGNISVSLQRYADARTHFTRLLAIQPWNTAARKALDALPQESRGDSPAGELRAILQDAQRSFDTGREEGIDEAINRIVQFKERTATNGVPVKRQRSFDELRTLIASGPRAQAIAALEEFIIESPTHAEAHNALGVLCYQEGNPDRSLELYRRAVELEPTNVVYRKNYADYLFVFRMDAEEALRQYVEVLSAQPRDVETLSALAVVCRDLGKIDDARFFVNTILELEPWNKDARVLRDALTAPPPPEPVPVDIEDLYRTAQASATDGKIEEAMALLEQVVRHRPAHAAAHNDLGVLNAQTGRLAEAGARYREAVRLDPDNAVFQKNLADYLFVEEGKAEEALRMYIQLLTRSPRDPDTLIGIGRLCEGVGRADAAKEFYQRALEAEPWNSAAKEQLQRLG